MREAAGSATLGFEAVLFDLDGVVTRTAELHAAAWAELFDEFLSRRVMPGGEPFRPFDPTRDYLAYVDGKPRYEGVRSFLAARGISLPEGDPTAMRRHRPEFARFLVEAGIDSMSVSPDTFLRVKRHVAAAEGAGAPGRERA